MQQTTQIYCVYRRWGNYLSVIPTVLAHSSRSYQTLPQLLIYDPSPSINPFSVIIGKAPTESGPALLLLTFLPIISFSQ